MAYNILIKIYICHNLLPKNQICIETIATAIELPVWVSRENVDLRICMLDRLYQDTIILNNRSVKGILNCLI